MVQGFGMHQYELIPSRHPDWECFKGKSICEGLRASSDSVAAFQMANFGHFLDEARESSNM